MVAIAMILIIAMVSLGRATTDTIRVVVREGETVDEFCQRTGIDLETLKELNPTRVYANKDRWFLLILYITLEDCHVQYEELVKNFEENNSLVAFGGPDKTPLQKATTRKPERHRGETSFQISSCPPILENL